MNESTTAALRDVVDIGVWTLGIVAAGVMAKISVDDVGLVGVLVPVVAVALLGVTGYFAVESVDNVLGDEEGRL